MRHVETGVTSGGGPRSYSPARAWGVVLLLFLASIVSVIDRMVLSVVVEPVKHDLHISDVQISLLQGLAFGLFYATIGIWLGFAADRLNRRNLVIGGLALWSVATIAGGLAGSFGELFILRMMVGLGEAALSPAAVSLIADLFPPGKRGRPIGIFIMGQAVASGIAISFTGAVLSAASRGDFLGVPLLSGLAPWRIVFVLCGLIGIVVSLAFLFTREPVREAEAARHSLRGQIGRTVRHLIRSRGRFIGVYLGFALCFLGIYGVAAWQVVLISRKFSLSASQVSAELGPIALVFGFAGPLVAGYVVDMVVRRGGLIALLWFLAFIPFLAVPPALAVLAPTPLIAALMCGVQSGVSATMGTAVLVYLQSATPADMRGVAVSLTGLTNTLFASSLGPMFIALTTEHVFHDDRMVGWSALWVAIPSYALAAVSFAVTAILLKRKEAVRAPVTASAGSL